MELFLERHWLLVLAILSLLYFAGTALRAWARPFWFDEILTLVIARQPSFAATFHAAGIADAMPPFTHLTIHLVNRLLGTGEVVSRIPGMIGFWVFCLCLFRYTIRRAGIFFALTAMLLPFATDSYGFSFEARCYGVLLGFGGLALVCWQAATAGERRGPAVVGLALSIACAMLNHYYAVLIYLPLAGAEVSRALRRRKIDWPIWAAFAAGAAPLVLSFFSIRHVIEANAHPWTRAHVRQYLDYYEIQGQHMLIFVIAVLALLAVNAILGSVEEQPASPRVWVPGYELLAAVLFLAIPLAAITLALLVPPHLFTERYAVLSIAGFALLAPMIGARVATGRAAVAGALAIAAMIPFLGELAQVRPFRNPLDQEPMLRGALQRGPVVINDGILFLQLWYYAPPALKQRIQYVADISSAVEYLNVDTIDLNLLSIAPFGPVPVVQYQRFATPGKEFLLYVSSGAGWLPQKILAGGGTMDVLQWSGGRALIRARMR